MTSETVQLLISTVLGGGLAITVTALIRGWRTLRAGARAREREGIADLAKWREEADDARRECEKDRQYWHSVAARYGYQLHRAGMVPDPINPAPPSERRIPRYDPADPQVSGGDDRE